MSDGLAAVIVRARTAVARLEMVSHGKTVNADSWSAPPELPPARKGSKYGRPGQPRQLSVSRGGGDGSALMPSAGSVGISGADDWSPEARDYPQKSHLAFRRRLRRCHVLEDYLAVARDAEAALYAWQHTPISGEPVYGSPQWKKWVGASLLSVGEIARRFNVSRQYITQIQRDYGTEESRAARAERNSANQALDLPRKIEGHSASLPERQGA